MDRKPLPAVAGDLPEIPDAPSVIDELTQLSIEAARLRSEIIEAAQRSAAADRRRIPDRRRLTRSDRRTA